MHHWPATAATLATAALVVMAAAEVLASPAATEEVPVCDLACWLAGVSVAVPDRSNITGSLPLGKSFQLDTANTSCGAFALDSVSSSTVSLRPEDGMHAKDNRTGALLNLGLGGAHAECSTWWHLKIFRRNGELESDNEDTTQLVITNSSVAVGVLLAGNLAGPPDTANLTQCFTNITISRVAPQPLTSDIPMNEIVQAALCSALSELVNQNLTALLASLAPYFTPSQQPLPPVPQQPEPLDMHTSALLNFVDFMADDVVGANGEIGLNRIIDHLTNHTGEIRAAGLPYAAHLPFSGGVFAAGISALALAGLDTWTLVDLFEPTAPQLLLSRTAAASLSLNAQLWLNLSLASGAVTATRPLIETVAVWGALSNAAAEASLQLVVRASGAENYTDAQCLNTECLAALVDPNATAAHRIAFNLSAATLSISLGSDSTLALGVAALANNVLGLATWAFPGALPSLLNGAVATAAVDAANAWLNTTLGSARCGYVTPPENPLEKINLRIACISLVSASLLATAVFIAGSYTARQWGAMQAKTKLTDVEAQQWLLAPKNTPTAAVYEPPCLLVHPRLPAAVRYGVPFLLFVNATMFLIGDTSGGVKTYFALTVGDGRVVNTGALGVFAFSNSIKMLWRGGMWPLAFLVAGFSGGWPFLKLLLMMACWVLPRCVLPIRWRELVLMALDALGKWSLIDSFMMIIMIVSFHFTLTFPVHDPATFTVDSPVGLDVIVQPLPGFVVFLAATVVSLVLGHVLLWLHRYADVPHARDNVDDTVDHGKSMLCLYAMVRRGRAVRVAVSAGVALLLIATLGLLLAGFVTDAFDFEFTAALGWFLSISGEDPVRRYSAWSLAYGLPQSSQHPNSFALRLVQVLFMATALVFPIALVLALLALWLIPMRRATRTCTFCQTDYLVDF
eukprot:TRINITY_DN3247_c0_g1_i1.p1 TRINITY_DN3247_c0_g1~~TRINITY_DN3247_c0_g1_i1.p1  ORF type:complete len:910 (-),score=207.25 TRINITY_DN3247_c0_g1_i1:548-3277(-)